MRAGHVPSRVKVPFSFMFRQIRHQTIIKQQARFLCPRHARGLL